MKSFVILGSKFIQRVFFCASFLLVVGTVLPTAFADTLIVDRGLGKQETLIGEVVEEARDRSCLFQTTDGRLEIFSADQIIEKKIEIETVPAMSRKELASSLLNELPKGFRVLRTKHYVIAYQTEVEYARWVETLYQNRLYPSFEKFARAKLDRYDLADPEFPLVAIVFSSKPEYARHVSRTLGIDVGDMLAHYNPMSNRVAMYDLTFDLGIGLPGRRPLGQILSQPAAIPMVATIIHEGTHQLMHNRGMQTRMADRPLWLNEGMAIYFEAPSLRNSKGWQRPGLPHPTRLAAFRRSLPTRAADSLETLIKTDDRFLGETAVIAYAESWALNYFLINKKRKEFTSYLKMMSEKKVSVPVGPEERLADFRKYFGDSIESLDKEFLAFVARMR